MIPGIIIAIVLIVILTGWLCHQFVVQAKLEMRLAQLETRNEELETFRAVPTRTPPTLIPNGWATILPEKRFLEIWQGVDEKEPLYLAVQQLLARETLDAIDYASRAELANHPGALTNAQGQVRALIDLAGAFQLARSQPEHWTGGQPPRRRGGEG